MSTSREQRLLVVLWTLVLLIIAFGVVAFTSGCATTRLDPRDPAVYQPVNPQYPTP